MLLTTNTSTKHPSLRDRTTKTKNLKRAKNLHWCNATVIKEIQTRRTQKTPAGTDGGSPGEEEKRATHRCKEKAAGRYEGGIIKKVGRIHC